MKTKKFPFPPKTRSPRRKNDPQKGECMTGWIIFGSILLVLILVLIQSVTVTAVLDKEFMLTVKILCFTLVKVPADPKKKKKKKKKKPDKQKRDNNAEKNTSDDTGGTAGKPDDGGSEKTADPQSADKPGKAAKSEKFKLGDGISFEMIKDYIDSAAPPRKRLLKKIRFRDIYIDYVVGSDDAAKTALKYGGICAAVYALLEWMKTYFSVKIGEVNIEADFGAEKDDIFVFGRVKLRISTALACIIWFGVRMLKTYLKYNTPKKTASRKPAGARR